MAQRLEPFRVEPVLLSDRRGIQTRLGIERVVHAGVHDDVEGLRQGEEADRLEGLHQPVLEIVGSHLYFYPVVGSR